MKTRVAPHLAVQRPTASSVTPDERQRVLFEHAFWSVVRHHCGLDVRATAIDAAGALRHAPRDGTFVLPATLAGEPTFAKQRVLMAALQVVLEKDVTSASREEVRHEGQSRLWFPSTRMSESSPFESKLSAKRALDALEPNWERHANALDASLASFPWSELEAHCEALGLPPALLERARTNTQRLRDEAVHQADAFLGTPATEQATAKSRRADRVSPEHRAQTAKLERALRVAFEARFLEGTSFGSFAEYEQAVLAVPEYRAFVERFWDDADLLIFRHERSRVSIMRHGLLGLAEAQTSAISTSPAYRSLRDEVEARALGTSSSDVSRDVPATLRPKSAFVASNGARPKASTQYGDDAYRLDGRTVKALAERGEMAVTFTLGDSLNADDTWSSMPIPAALFPVVAAPFVLDARKKLRRDDVWLSLRYRKAAPGLPAIAPSFAADLAKRLGVRQLTSPDANVESRDGSNGGYLEAQLWGPVFASDAEALFVRHDKQPGKRLWDVYDAMELDVATYKDRSS